MLAKMLLTADPAWVMARTATSEISATAMRIDQILTFVVTHERTQTSNEIHLCPPARVFTRTVVCLRLPVTRSLRNHATQDRRAMAVPGPLARPHA